MNPFVFEKVRLCPSPSVRPPHVVLLPSPHFHLQSPSSIPTWIATMPPSVRLEAIACAAGLVIPVARNPWSGDLLPISPRLWLECIICHAMSSLAGNGAHCIGDDSDDDREEP